MQDVKIRCAVGEDGATHFGIGGIDDARAERLGLALELESLRATRAQIIEGSGASASWV